MHKLNINNSNNKNKLTKSDGGDEIWVTEFNQDEALKFREKIIAQSQEDPSAPIIVRINSYGGEVDSLAMMIETLDELPNPIITSVEGVAMSCGAILLSHGDLRWCGKYSRVMIHEVSGGAIGDTHSVHMDALELKRVNKLFMGLLAKNCNIRGGYDGLRKILKGRDGKDMYLSAEDALNFGIVDAIGCPRMNTYLTYDVRTAKPKSFQIKKDDKTKEPQKPIRMKKRGKVNGRQLKFRKES